MHLEICFKYLIVFLSFKRSLQTFFDFDALFLILKVIIS